MATLTDIAGQSTSSVDYLVQLYMAQERKPITSLEQKKASINTQIAVYNDAKSKLTAILNAADVLADTSNSSIFNSVTVNSSDTSAISISAGTSAAVGTYDFRVRQLATATAMKSTATLNNNPSVMSSNQVVANPDSLDTDEGWDDAGFDTTPDGTVTVNGMMFTLSDYTSVDDFMEAVSERPSIMSSGEVVASGSLDTSQSWAAAGFDTTPDGTVTINSVEFTLTDYSTVDDFIAAVNDSTANVDLHYDETEDRFVMISETTGGISLSETGTNGFFTEANIATGTADTSGTGANLYYDSVRDKFIFESTDGTDLVLDESGTNGFLTEINIATGTHSTNATGLNSDDYLYKINFDNSLSETDSGSFKINGVEIEWDADEDTLDSIISDINASEAGVTAFYDDSLDRVVINATTMGSDEIQIEEVTGTFLTSSLKLSQGSQTVGQDAKFTINSTDSADEITKASNSFVINGITYNLKEVTVANNDYTDGDTEAVTVTSTKNEEGLKTKINAFLSAYNSFADYIKAKTAVDTTTYTRGALAGDTVFTGIKGDVINLFLGQVDGLDEDKPSYFSEIGITFDDNMHLTISDSTTLSDWLDEDPQAVANLFNSTNGIAAQMVDLLEPYTESYGIIFDKKESLNEKIDSIDSRIDMLESRMDRREAYYYQQFSALQEALNMVSLQQSTLSSLTSSLSSTFGY